MVFTQLEHVDYESLVAGKMGNNMLFGFSDARRKAAGLIDIDVGRSVPSTQAPSIAWVHDEDAQEKLARMQSASQEMFNNLTFEQARRLQAFIVSMKG